MARGDTGSRLIRLLLMLAHRRTGDTVTELAAELNVSVRTVYRDLRALEAAGLPLTSESEGGQTVHRLLDTDRWRVGLALALPEVAALNLAARTLRAQGGEPWAASLDSALGKIEAAVAGSKLERLAELVGSVSVSERGRHDYAARGDILREVTTALYERRPLDMQYATGGAGAPRPRRIHPYLLRREHGGLYLVAHDELSSELRVFSLDRIRLATVAEGRFDVPEDFDPDEFFRDAFGVFRGGEVLEVQVRFGPPVAHLPEERRWHPSQLVERDELGALVRISVCDSPELRGWIRSFGPDVEVLAPDSLARAIEHDAERVTQLYRARRAGRTVALGRARERTAARTRGRGKGRE